MLSNYMFKRNFILKFFFVIIGVIYINTQTQPQQSDAEKNMIHQLYQTMSDFIPTQGFKFNIEIGQPQEFLFQSQQDILNFRSFYYVQSYSPQQIPTIFSTCELNGVIKRQQKSFTFGVCQLNFTERFNNIRLIFETFNYPANVHFSYQLKKTKTSQTNTKLTVLNETEQQIQDKKSKVASIINKFERVQVVIQGQQNWLRMIVNSISSQNKILSSSLNYVQAKIIIESVLIVMSGLVSLYILSFTIRKGYELLV